jgi:hypothetical protein
MPSPLHEILVELFRNRPELAPELLRDALGVKLPAYSDAQIDSADLPDVRPAAYHSDLVVSLAVSGGVPVHGIIVETQLQRRKDKRLVWPNYVTALRARHGIEVSLLVVTPKESVARWAREPIHLGGGNLFTPLVLGPSAIPQITNPVEASARPELAVLSALAHGRDEDAGQAACIAAAAMAAIEHLDEARNKMYFDLIWASMSEDARRKLQTMDPAKYEYQSELARKWVAEGKAEGKAEGRLEGEREGRVRLLSRLLTLRFGALPADAQARLEAAALDELDAIGERLLSAATLGDALSALTR